MTLIIYMPDNGNYVNLRDIPGLRFGWTGYSS
jgi:hypothetical protein